MATTIERVRAAVVVGAALLALIVAGFLTMAHRRGHRLLRDLPARLGADIQKETNGYTVSQSVKGHTVFTLHAAKASQHKDGRTGLEDVGIVLYGQKDGRADRIYGKQFDYDQKNGVVRAMGEVHLDLQAPAPTTAGGKAAYARGGAGEATAAKATEAQPIHVVTSGLVYVQSRGVASTDQPIRFDYHGMTGQARGAEYDSGTGLTTLQSEVKLSTLRDGRPTLLTAAHAELRRASHEVVLRSARYLAIEKEESDRGASEAMTAGTMVVHLREDGGGIASADGSDGVEVVSGASRMQAPNGALQMTAEGRPESAQMTGGVHFQSESDRAATQASSLEGRSAAALAHFDEKGVIKAVRLTGGVEARAKGTAADEMRTLRSGAMDLVLAGQASGGRRWIERATMRGDARVESALPAISGHTAGTEEMRADVLTGEWQGQGGDAVLRRLTGEGHTEVRRRRDGADEVSRGDRLDAEFGPANKTGGGDKAGVTQATQRGGVTIDRTLETAASGGAQAETTHGRADQVSYDGTSGRVRLTGAPEIANGESRIRAELIALTESTGDTEATGAVQVTYRQMQDAGAKFPPSSTGAETREATHVTADHAVLRKESGIATFFGTPTLRARLWQGGAQVEAPVLALARKGGTLDAYGTGGKDSMPVRTVLPGKARSDAAAGAKDGARLLRVQSGRLHYADTLRRADFLDGVLLQDADGTMASREAKATLSPVVSVGTGAEKERQGPQVAGFSGLSGGALETVTAEGDVLIRQPGRVATGQQAIYTAASGEFVLTGGDGAPPKATDELNGTVTGAVLRFRSGDNSVTVDGRADHGTPTAGDGRVHTHTKVKQ